ncbi:hypothetical protein FRC09_002462, partial [Ceratobasidium sp. 395]
MDEDEDGEDDGDDKDDVFAAIPTATKHALPSPRQPSVFSQARPRPRISRPTYVSSDADSDGSFVDVTTSHRTRRRTSFLVDGNQGETENGSERSESSETDTNTSESDFDWTQYNRRYHPHDRVSSFGSKSTRPKENPPKHTNVAPRRQIGRGTAPAVRSS